MTKHINYAINKEFYGNDNLYKDGEPTISNGNDFERADNCIRVYRMGFDHKRNISFNLNERMNIICCGTYNNIRIKTIYSLC